ncbi:hypothetical protein AX14_011436 [Amanita brunnescens Koide BX004]|nr:hypothetical protein AX14_011436 [Amanita brunnescens Koide BX004]
MGNILQPATFSGDNSGVVGQNVKIGNFRSNQVKDSYNTTDIGSINGGTGGQGEQGDGGSGGNVSVTLGTRHGVKDVPRGNNNSGVIGSGDVSIGDMESNVTQNSHNVDRIQSITGGTGGQGGADKAGYSDSNGGARSPPPVGGGQGGAGGNVMLNMQSRNHPQ